MHSLPVFLRLQGRSVILVGAGAAAAAKRRLLERAGARVVAESDEARLAIVAAETAAEATAAAERLGARGILVNVVDRPALCDFTLPAIVDRDPVLVAIGTGGVSAGLAAALRQRLEAVLPARLGQVAHALHDARAALKSRLPDDGARRRALGALMGEGGALDLLVEHPDPAAAIETAAPEARRVERVALTSPDPDLLTLRAARLIGQADRLYHPADLPAAILARARADAERMAAPAPARPLPGLSVELAWA